MYANLRVTVPSHDPEVMYAWKVEATLDGGHVVHLDGNDGNGNYAEPAGTVEFGAGEPLTVVADF